MNRQIFNVTIPPLSAENSKEFDKCFSSLRSILDNFFSRMLCKEAKHVSNSFEFSVEMVEKGRLFNIVKLYISTYHKNELDK